MFIKKFSECESMIMRGKKDPAINVQIIEMFRPQDGFELSYNVAQFNVPKGMRTDKYFLKSTTELWFIKEGHGVAEIAGKSIPVDGQMLIYINAGEERCLKNMGNGSLVYHSIAQPPFRPDDVASLEETEIEFIKP
jgi:mannose-6-phosphate isomerase-like protein (cupin superfamily)